MHYIIHIKIYINNQHNQQEQKHVFLFVGVVRSTVVARVQPRKKLVATAFGPGAHEARHRQRQET